MDSNRLRARLSGNDALKLIEIVGACLSCNGEDELREVFPKIQDLFPFDYAIAVLGNRDRERGVFPAHSFNINFPEEWVREYLTRDYMGVDTVVLQSFDSHDTQIWPLTRKLLFRRREITSLGMDFGMRECCACGSKPMFGSRLGSMFCFAGPAIECSDRHRAVLDVVVPHLHLALSRHSGKNTDEHNTAILLSNREREIINWMKQGKTSWEISVILNISARTVNFHAGNIMRKLGVSNRAQAVAVAVRSGLINLDVYQ